MRRLFTIALFVSLLAPVAAHATEVRAHGLLDLVLSSGEAARYTNLLTQGDSNFDPYRVHLFLDAKVSPTIDVYLEMILHEGITELRADGAYAQWTPWADRDLHVEAGKVPWPIGTWAARTYSDHNPLVGMPLMYQYHTSLSWSEMPASIDDLVGSAGGGQGTLGYTNGFKLGMPVVDDRWWDVGAVLLGSQRPFEYSIGVLQGTPGWPITTIDETPGSSVLGRLGLAPTAGVRVGASASWGTWMPEWFSYALPAGRSLRDYHEGLVMGDLELSRGPWELRSEGFLKQWETITAGTLHLHGGYGEARFGLSDGAWLAARYDMIRFANVTTSAGVRRPWDDGVDRLEAGIGYRVNRDLRIKTAYQRDLQHPFGAKDQARDMYTLAASIRL